MSRFASIATLAATLLLAACNQEAGGTGGLPGDPEDTTPFALIAEDETVHFTGTEPFWGGEATGGMLNYSTPENIEGRDVAVTRFEGRGGLSFSGELGGAAFDLLVTEGQCSDGMSDRSFPFVATLSLGGEVRHGCAWTAARPFTGGE